jgi:hypothetical protein
VFTAENAAKASQLLPYSTQLLLVKSSAGRANKMFWHVCRVYAIEARCMLLEL